MTAITQKDPAEAFAVEFDFTANLSTITIATCTASISGGPTGDASAILLGSPQISGSKVLQRVNAGQAGSDYALRCTATDGTETYVLVATLPVRTAA